VRLSNRTNPSVAPSRPSTPLSELRFPFDSSNLLPAPKTNSVYNLFSLSQCPGPARQGTVVSVSGNSYAPFNPAFSRVLTRGIMAQTARLSGRP
jgi:hypothetical protein